MNQQQQQQHQKYKPPHNIFDHCVAETLQRLRIIEQGEDVQDQVKELKRVLQIIHTKLALLGNENRHLKQELADLYQFRGKYNDYLAEALTELTSVAHDQEPMAEDSQASIMAALAHTQEQFLDNKTWQTKLHRVYMENIELRDSIEQLKADQIHLNETVNLLKTELCGRIQQIQLLSQGLATADNPVYARLLAEMEQNTKRAIANSDSRKERMIENDIRQQHRTPLDDEKKATNGNQTVDKDVSVTKVADSTDSNQCHRRTVRLEKAATGGFGLRIQGGALDDNPEIKSPVVVEKVYPMLPAHMSGRIFPGDTVVAINETVVEGLRHSDVIQLIQQSGSTVILQLESQASLIPTDEQEDFSGSSASKSIIKRVADELGKGEYKAVVDTATAGLADDPGLIPLFLLRSKAHYHLNQLEDAEHDCAIVLDHRVTGHGLYTLSCIYFAQEKLNQAHEMARFACQVDPRNATFNSHLRHVSRAIKVVMKEERQNTIEVATANLLVSERSNSSASKVQTSQITNTSEHHRDDLSSEAPSRNQDNLQIEENAIQQQQQSARSSTGSAPSVKNPQSNMIRRGVAMSFLAQQPTHRQKTETRKKYNHTDTSKDTDQHGRHNDHDEEEEADEEEPLYGY